MNIAEQKKSGTFVLNKQEMIHRWYPYLEGYSSILIQDIIKELPTGSVKAIYDPFCGTGTTCLVASSLGIKSYYSETNPFMDMVIESKINAVKRLRDKKIYSKNIEIVLNKVKRIKDSTPNRIILWDGFEKFFDNYVLDKVLKIKKLIEDCEDEESKKILYVLLSSVIVRASKMIRQGDLRMAKDSEKKTEDKDIVTNFINKVESAIEDINNKEAKVLRFTKCLNQDSRDIEDKVKFNCIITSPPYLNGTNYIRNTKLELKLCGFIESEKELPAFHSKGIIAGINNVSKRKSNINVLEIVKPYLNKLEPIAYDDRIPKMVAGYFDDMQRVIHKISLCSESKSYFIMDIGDSQFAGVHIPTHELLVKICEQNGFKLYDECILRERYSKNGMLLSQRLLKMRKD